MFILITAPRSNGPERPRVEPWTPASGEKQSQSNCKNGSDSFTPANNAPSEVNNSDPRTTPDPLRIFLGTLLKDPKLTDKEKDFLTRFLLSNNEDRRTLIRQMLGPEAADLFGGTSSKPNDKAQQQRDMLTIYALLGHLNPASALSGIKSVDWLPEVVGLAGSIAAGLADFGNWLAKEQAKKGKSDLALAMYHALQDAFQTHALQSNATQITNTTNPSSELAQNTASAHEANRKKQQAESTQQEIRMLTAIVSGAPHENPTPEQITAQKRLGDLRDLTSA